MNDLFNQFVLCNEDFCFAFKSLNILYRGKKYFEISVNFENDKQESFCKKNRGLIRAFWGK